MREAKADFDRMVNIIIDYDLADRDDAVSLVNKFKDFKDRNLIKGRNRDISTWYSRPVEFIDFIEDLENKKSKTQKNKQAKEGAELVAKNNEWKVYRIETHAASCFYGKGTKWCTAGRGSRYFNDYKKRGIVLYYIISDTKKYAIALYPNIVSTLQEYGIKTNFELFDERDNRIIDKEELENVLNKFPKIPNIKLILEFLSVEIRDNVLIRVYPHNSSEFIIPDNVTSIGDGAFRDCTSLTSITIPDSVTSIGAYAFCNCSNLTSITIPEGITSIGNYTFYGCKSLTSITIPDSVTSIGSDAFSNCSSLTSVTIPDSVTSIRGYAFSGCTSLTSITIPDSITSIDSGAFEGCSSLTSITIPDSITSIGDSAFKFCLALTSITIPNSITSIGNFAFSYCDSLTSITISDSVTSIGSGVFYNCSALTSITIPDSITSIGDYTFAHCSSLTSITIPDSVTSIGDYTFQYCTALTSITIPSSITSIGNYAFYGCSSLTSIIIPKSVISIGDYAFFDCHNLTIYVEAESKPKGWRKTWAPDDMPVIWGYKQTKNLKEAKADFDRMANILVDYDLANSNEAVLLVKKFKDFKDRNLIKGRDRDISTWYSRPVEFIDFIEDLENKKSKTQKNKQAKKGAELVAKNNEWKVYRIYTHTASCLYGKGTKWCTAGKDSRYFRDYKKRGIVLYYVISNNKKYAIALYPEIIDVLQWYGVKANFELFDEKDNLIIDKEELENALNKFPKIPNIKLTLEFLPAEVKGNVLIRVYPYNSGEFIIPDNITSIGDHAFQDCTSLTSIIIPDSVTSIGDGAFSNCKSLTSITIPDSVTSIGAYAFSNCKSLTSITIPKGITSIGNDAFFSCDSLTSITIPKSVTSIGNFAFYGCSSLTSITIPDSVTSIGNYTFSSCRSLTSITIPDSVTSIGNYTFSSCSSLTSVAIPDSVTSIGDYAFYNCYSLTSIIIPDSITSIGNYTFTNCSSLTSITIPKSVTSIGSYAFYGCYNLTIYAEAESKPEGWHQTWAPDNMPVIWGYKQIKNLREAKADFDRMANILVDYDLADSDEAVLLVNKFKDFKDRNLIKGRDRDISTWYSRPVEFIDFIEDLESKKSKTQKNKQAKDVGATLVYEDEEWFIYRIDTWEASCLYGKGTKWCISGENSKFWDDYAKATVYFCISKILPESNPFHKIAIIIDYIPNYYLTTMTEVYDAEDNELDIEDLPDSLYYLLYDVMIYEDPRDTNKGLFTIHDGVLTTVNVHSADILEVPEGITHIGYKAFTRVKVKKVILPEGLVSIGADAFRDCIYLEEVTLPSTLEVIGTWAFINTNLKEIELPESLEGLGKNPFDLDTLLIIPDTISDDIYYEIAYETMYEYKVIKTK